MAVLHSFYCWGSVGVICLSTLFFALFGTQSWKILTAVWIVLPLFNFFYFIKVPIASAEEGEKAFHCRSFSATKCSGFFC